MNSQVEYETDLTNILSSIFPNEENREAFLNHYANIYYGKTKSFDVWYGTGNNGKSVLFKLFQKAFPENTEYLPTPTNFKDFRLNAEIFIIPNIDSNEKINPKSLYQFLNTKNCGTVVAVVNSLEQVSNMEGINIINFNSRFVTNPINENEFLIDMSLLDNIRNNKYSKDLRKMLKIRSNYIINNI